MKIDTPLHADHQLDQLSGQFAHWRQHRSHPYERIPDPLWDQAVALTATLSASRVAKHLRLRGSDLKKQIARRQGSAAAQMPTAPGFVEVRPSPVQPQGFGSLEVELYRTDGARLHARARRLAATGRYRAQFYGDLIMLQLTPQSRIFLATEPVDFRKGIDGLGAVCRQRLGDNPLEGAVYVFRNRSGTALKLLLYDGQGYWLMMKRLSQGRFTWWPQTLDAQVPLSARELIILLWNGDPEQAHMARDWRRVA